MFEKFTVKTNTVSYAYKIQRYIIIQRFSPKIILIPLRSKRIFEPNKSDKPITPLLFSKLIQKHFRIMNFKMRFLENWCSRQWRSINLCFLMHLREFLYLTITVRTRIWLVSSCYLSISIFFQSSRHKFWYMN